jgi:muramoyltetrapeptide carboxypeptidase
MEVIILLIRVTLLTVISFLLSAFSNLEFNKNNAEFIGLLKDIKITVIAPGSGVSDEVLRNLKDINSLKLDIPNNCFDGSKSLFHANSDQMRYKCLKDALLGQSKILWALRGGYGSAKLIGDLQDLKKPIEEKIFIGFSDMTALHIFLSQEWGWKTIHGGGIAEIIDKNKDRQNFIKIAKIISSKIKQTKITGLLPINLIAKSSKDIISTITGGNLTIIQTSIGTNWQIKTDNKIVFLEDVGIKPYQLDRVLNHLKQVGLFDHVKAIIFGACGSDDKNITDTLTNFATTLKIPVFKTNKFGHEQVNEPIIYNSTTKIISTNDGQFELIMKIGNF